jgi:ADP-heptose:LPS heptosyltransferase
LKALVVCAGGGIGDVLLATPVMRALRMRYASVAALTAPAHRDVLARNPDLAEVLLDDGSFGEVRARLARERFDAAVVTWAAPRSAALPFAAGIPVRVGQGRRLYSMLFNRRVTVRSELGDRTTHWTQILLDFARALECDVEDATPVFAFDERAASDAKTLLDDAGIRGEYAVLHPTRAIASARARWPSQRLGLLGRSLRDAFALPLVVTGDAHDRDIAEAVAEASGSASLAGRTSLAQFGALAAGARFTVAMDSGPMHIAAAVGAPTVGIFALQSDEPDRWRPLGKRTAIVRPSYPCPPSHRKETCPDFACVRELATEPVIRAVAGLLEGAPHAGL